jgi:hypothetical protein
VPKVGFLLGFVVLAGLCLPSAARAQDDDGDGWTLDEGDCDDDDASINPGVDREICGDLRDNDCNGWSDDGCDYSVRQGTLRGGGGCTGNGENEAPTGEVAALLALPALARRRQRT